MFVNCELLFILGVMLLFGCNFSVVEDVCGGLGVVLFSYVLWMSCFGGDCNVLG